MHPKARRGFNLTELMIASGLIVTFLVPVLIFNQRGVIEAGVTQEELMGRQLVMDLCERFKAASPDELQGFAEDPGKIESDPMLIPVRGTPQEGMAFERRVEFERNYQGEVGLHKATFVVAWASRHRKPQVAKLSRLIHWH
jgi:hypothetical protein